MNGQIKVGLIGGGYRALYFLRAAKAVPEAFSLKGVLLRDPQKAREFEMQHGVKTFTNLESFLDTGLDYVILCISRSGCAAYLEELIQRGIPVLCETPPGANLEELKDLWEISCQKKGRVQVAEQYFLQPLYMAWYSFLQTGLLGNLKFMSLSALHGYHGMSMLRRFLGVGFENCVISGKRYPFTITETDSRAGMIFDGRMGDRHRDRAALEFESGKVGFFDFSDVQYHSFIRTRQLTVQGTRGEIDDLTVRYLRQDNIPVCETLCRTDLGVYNGKQWAHHSMMLGDKLLYQTPFPGARLNDDELAVASCMERMGHYVKTGEDFYPLREALQDSYLSFVLEEAVTSGKTIQTERQAWAK